MPVRARVIVRCSCPSVPVSLRARARWSLVARVIVGCSYPSVLLLVRYSFGGRAATRLLLIRGRAATRPLLAQRPCCYSPATPPRPCCYSSATRPAAVLLLVRYSPAAVLLLVRNARPAAVLLLAPGRHWWAAATGVYKYPQKKSFLEPQDFRATRTHPAGVSSLEVPCRPACGNSAVVVWRKPKDRHAHFQRKSGPSGLLVVVVVVLLLLLLDLASANRTGAEARRGAEARKCGGAEGKGSSGSERSTGGRGRDREG